MKKLILLNCLVFLFATARAKPVPAEIQRSFSLKFPSATNVHWSRESQKEWEAEFVNEGVKTSANFLLDGNWVETETEIPVTQLPEKVVSAIKAAYTNWRIVEADKIVKSNGELLFEAELKVGIRKKEVVLKEDGTFH